MLKLHKLRHEIMCYWELSSVFWSLGIEGKVSSILIPGLYSSALNQKLDGLWLVTVFPVLTGGKVLCTSCITEMRSDVCQRLGSVSIKMAWKWSISPVGNWTRSVPGIALSRPEDDLGIMTNLGSSGLCANFSFMIVKSSSRRSPSTHTTGRVDSSPSGESKKLTTNRLTNHLSAILISDRT